MDPYPLSAEQYLVSHNPDKPWKDVRAYGLYLIDEFGNHSLLYKDPEFSCWQPYPLRPRTTPPVVPDARDLQLAKKNLAICMVQDVYHGMEGVERGSVKYLRVMEQVPRPWACRRFWDPRGKYGSHTALVSRGSVLAVKVLHGVVPVYGDGSAHFYVPADRDHAAQTEERPMSSNDRVSRRRFMAGAAAVGAVSVVSRRVLGGPVYNPPSNKLNVAIRTRQKLQWDGRKQRFTNFDEANRFLNPPYREGWTL